MNGCTLRVAREGDADSVSAVLASAYAGLMAPDYNPAVMAIVLPSLVIANPGLLASGTYYVQEAAGRIVSCGGWTREEPGTGRVADGIAHVRHFATHAGWIRNGLGAGIFARCRQDALAAGVHNFKCFSSLGAERFYGSLGFRVVERVEITIGGLMKMPTIAMVWPDAG